jgi:hypothetical protein
MGTVYIVQETLKRDRETGQLVRIHDLSPAAIYGTLVPLLEQGKSPSVLATVPIVHELKRKLKNFGDDDSLLAVGDPVVIGLATAVAAQINHGRVSVLKWDRESRSYIRVSFEL